MSEDLQRKHMTWKRHISGADLFTKETGRPHKNYFEAPDCKIQFNEERQGYGVYAARDYEPGEIVEEVPALVLHTTVESFGKGFNDLIAASFLYKFNSTNPIVDEVGHPFVIPMGNGLAYSKSENYNVHWSYDHTFSTIVYRASRKIESGQELTIAVVPGQLGPSGIDVSSLKKKSGGCSSCAERAKKRKEEREAEANKMVEEKNEDLKKQNKFKSMESDEVLETVVVEDSSTEVLEDSPKEEVTLKGSE